MSSLTRSLSFPRYLGRKTIEPEGEVLKPQSPTIKPSSPTTLQLLDLLEKNMELVKTIEPEGEVLIPQSPTIKPSSPTTLQLLDLLEKNMELVKTIEYEGEVLKPHSPTIKPSSPTTSLPLDFIENNMQLVSLGVLEGQKIQLDQEQKTVFRHFSHRHPLSYWENRMDAGFNPFARCYICYDVGLNEPIYSCYECKTFIHESCFELPQHISTTIHSENQLELCDSSGNYNCDSCHKRIYGCRYTCSLCDFDIHVTCASQYIVHDPRVHDKHSFIDFLKPNVFTCDACGVDEKINYLSRICTGCQLQVHKKCSYSFPLTVKQRQHSHALTLTYAFQIHFDFARKTCRLCFQKMNNVYCLYQCNPCAYITHVSCATSYDIVVADEEDDTGGDCDALGVQIEESLFKHFHHPHNLSFSNDEPKIDAVCDGCVRPISVPFYKCVDDNCNFILHKHCFELPQKIQHPLHPHPLTLKGHPSTWWSYIIARCDSCLVSCNGFIYNCMKCDFMMDVNCASLSDTLVHESHKCTLILIDTDRNTREEDINDTKCSACGLKCSCKFVCEKECNFEIDMKCASLPKTTKHECPMYNWGIRPLKLMYEAIKDASGEYYCDICEESRGENDWFYYCEDCNWSNHPQCVLGEELTKFGGTYRVDNHPHLLILSKMPRGNHSCHICEKTLNYSFVVNEVFFCRECGIYIHIHYCCRNAKLVHY